MAAMAGGLAGRSAAQPDEVRRLLQRELRRSQPDYVVYVPGHYDGSTNDSHNEHFLVFEGPDRSLMAVWTQSSGLRGRGPQNRIMFSRSDDDGVTWARPRRVAGPADPNHPAPMASWGFPMVSRSGRIYVLYNQNDGTQGWIQMHTGRIAGVHSDDQGASFSQPQFIDMPPSPYDDPGGKIPPEGIVWQIPMRDLKGGRFVGYTRWASPARAYYKKVENWTQIESVCEFMRLENVDKDPQLRDLRIRYSAWGERALRAPYYLDRC